MAGTLAACAPPSRAVSQAPELELRLVSEGGGWPLAQWKGSEKIYVEREILFSGKDFEAVTPSLGGDDNKTPALWLHFTPQGAARFSETTTRWTGRKLAVVIGGKVAAAPRILHPVTTGLFEITGPSDDLVRQMTRAAYPRRAAE